MEYPIGVIEVRRDGWTLNWFLRLGEDEIPASRGTLAIEGDSLDMDAFAGMPEVLMDIATDFLRKRAAEYMEYATDDQPPETIYPSTCVRAPWGDTTWCSSHKADWPDDGSPWCLGNHDEFAKKVTGR